MSMTAQKDLLESGEWVRASALGFGDGVLVEFKNLNGERIVCIMTNRHYSSIELGKPATLKMFKEYGKVIELGTKEEFARDIKTYLGLED